MAVKMPSMIRQWLGVGLRRALQVPMLSRLARIVIAEWHEVTRQRAVAKVKAALTSVPDDRVRRGPFQGMHFPFRYGNETGWLGKILGAYESELHGVIDRICRDDYTQVINIGTAEGFYFVGLARRLPAARITGFETNEEAREACQELALANGVARRIVLHGTCNIETLQTQDISGGRVLVVADCEGEEYRLLQPALIPALNECDLLVELHCLGTSGMGPFESISSILSNTHTLQFISCRPRMPSQFQELGHLTEVEADMILSEGRRNSVGWVFARSRCRHGSQPKRGSDSGHRRPATESPTQAGNC